MHLTLPKLCKQTFASLCQALCSWSVAKARDVKTIDIFSQMLQHAERFTERGRLKIKVNQDTIELLLAKVRRHRQQCLLRFFNPGLG